MLNERKTREERELIQRSFFHFLFFFFFNFCSLLYIEFVYSFFLHWNLFFSISSSHIKIMKWTEIIRKLSFFFFFISIFKSTSFLYLEICDSSFLKIFFLEWRSIGWFVNIPPLSFFDKLVFFPFKKTKSQCNFFPV